MWNSTPSVSDELESEPDADSEFEDEQEVPLKRVRRSPRIAARRRREAGRTTTSRQRGENDTNDCENPGAAGPSSSHS